VKLGFGKLILHIDFENRFGESSRACGEGFETLGENSVSRLKQYLPS